MCARSELPLSSKRSTTLPLRASLFLLHVDVLSKGRRHFDAGCECAAQLSLVILQLVSDAHGQLQWPRQESVRNPKPAACCFLSSSTLKQVAADLMDFVLAHLFLALEFALARRIDLSEMSRMLSGSPPGGESPSKAPGCPSTALVFLHVIRLFCLTRCVLLLLFFFFLH